MDKGHICLDTSILIDYYRKKNKSKTKFVQLSKKYTFCISVITKLEILAGITGNQKDFWNKIFEKLVGISSGIVVSLCRFRQALVLQEYLG